MLTVLFVAALLALAALVGAALRYRSPETVRRPVALRTVAALVPVTGVVFLLPVRMAPAGLEGLGQALAGAFGLLGVTLPLSLAAATLEFRHRRRHGVQRRLRGRDPDAEPPRPQ